MNKREGATILTQREALRIALAQKMKEAQLRQPKRTSATMPRNDQQYPEHVASSLTLNEAQSPYKADVWRQLTPRERLRRSWQMRSRLPSLKAVHDRKLFPKP